MFWLGAAGSSAPYGVSWVTHHLKAFSWADAFARMSGASDVAGMAGDAGWVSLHMVSTPSLFFEGLILKGENGIFKDS